MTAKDIRYREECRAKILQGVKTLAEAVAITLGPKGRNVVLDRKFGAPHITKDGVTVAKEIELEDKHENMGAQMVKQVASKTADRAGDGTTTATVLAWEIFQEGLRNIAAGANPMDLKRGIETGVKVAIEHLKSLSKPVRDKREITQVAAISANNDREIGELIASAMERVGKDGSVTVEEAKGLETQLEVVEGMNFDRGYVSPYFVTNQESQEAILENASILLCEKKISTIKELLPILQAVAEAGRPLVIIAEDVENEALATLVVNRLRGGLKVCAVKSPGFGDRRKEIMHDLAVLTGAQLISEELGQSLESASLDVLGHAEKIIVSKESTTLVRGGGSREAIDDRCAQLRRQLATVTSDYDRDKLQERLSKLSGGVAVIRVGATTEIEMKEKKDRVVDAQQATAAAVEEGILPGGGVALVRCLTKVRELAQTLESDMRTGVLIVARALSAPLRQIAQNAGKEGIIILQEVEKLPTNSGYNAYADKFEDLVAAGVLDPLKVVRSALENAASIAAILLTTEATVADAPEPEKGQMPAHATASAGMDY